MNHSNYLDILKRYWGYDSFRGIQKEIIESIGAGQDTLGLMPTGGGKSICFQVPALAQDGLCLVVTPLVALMKDQVGKLRQLGIKAAAIHSGMKHQQILVTLENCIFGDYKFLYVSPERLSSDLFLVKLHHMKVSFICVDEAHCISQWGYDFRPSYMKLQDIRKELPNAPVLALTATATREVVQDIQQKLGFKEENVFRMSFARPNLYYGLYEDAHTADSLSYLLNHYQGSTIIYCNNRERCEEVAKLLTEMGFSAAYFHAGLPEIEKDFRQRDWYEGRTRIMVATNAFGMGIDKADVRLVLHILPPDSLEAYYQEAGRAGRDGKPSWAIMLHNVKEIQLLKQKVAKNFPPKELIQEIYDHICYYLQIGIGSGLGVTRQFNMYEFCHYFKHSSQQVRSALEILELSGYTNFTDEEETISRMQILATRSQLYNAIHGETETLFNYLLRTYSGIFREFVYIDEDNISAATGFGTHDIYEHLVALSHINIIRYIPRRKIPFIQLTQERVEGKDLVIRRAAYEERKERYEKRITEMVRYMEEKNECRTRFLLHYFDEDYPTPCHNCDNCHNRDIEKNGYTTSKSVYEIIRQDILQQLSHGPMYGYALNISPYSLEDVEQTVQQMTENGELIQDGLKLALKHT